MCCCSMADFTSHLLSMGCCTQNYDRATEVRQTRARIDELFAQLQVRLQTLQRSACTVLHRLSKPGTCRPRRGDSTARKKHRRATT